MEKSQMLLAKASALESDNRECQRKVESLDREMLEVREEQRTWEDDYSCRMNEIRVKITGSKRNYSPDLLEKRGQELREEKVRLLERCVQIEADIGREEKEDESQGT